MTTTTIYYGLIDAMIAECSVLEMDQDFLDQYGFKYAVLAHDDASTNYDTDFACTLAEARAIADELAAAYNGTVARI